MLVTELVSHHVLGKLARVITVGMDEVKAMLAVITLDNMPAAASIAPVAGVIDNDPHDFSVIVRCVAIAARMDR
jgi:hypothetical protein